MSIVVSELTKTYGHQKAVDNISFKIGNGEIVGFLGPNGAGKSTTMKMLTCYTAPDSGKAMVGGHDILKETMAVKRSTGYLPETNPLYKEMYVREYLSFMAAMHKGSKISSQRINEMIALTGLTPESKKKIGALSKGYRQRVGLAQALLHDPEVLILDEPTSGLDPNQIIEIRNVIREAGKEKTVLLSSHIMQEVQAMCDRILIINKGVIVADDDTSKLINRFSGNLYLRVKFKNKVSMDDLLKIKGVQEVTDKRDYFILALTSDVREAVFDFAVKTNNPLLEMVNEGESLEKVFQEITLEKEKS